MRSLKAEQGGAGAAMPFIMLTVLIDMIAVGLTVPVLPPLLGSMTVSVGDQAFWYGVVVVAFGLGNFIGSPILGALSDAYGRRPVLLIGFCGLALNFFATALATQVWMLVLVRFVGGAMQSNGAVANAYAADITPPEERARRFGLLGAMFGLGFILGPVMGGLLGSIHLTLPFTVAGGLAVLNWLYGYFVLPESLPAGRRRPFAWRAANPAAALRKCAVLGGSAGLVWAYGLSALAQTIGYISWVLYGTYRFGWGPAASGWSLAAIGAMSVVMQGFLLKPVLKRTGPQRLALAGLLSATLANLLYGLADQGWMMYAIIVFNTLGYTVTSTLQSIVSADADPRQQGATMGAVSAVGSLTGVLAPVLGAPLLSYVSTLGAHDWRVGAPFYFCCLLQGAALVAALLYFRRRTAAAARVAEPEGA